jgi:hypothetical protein
MPGMPCGITSIFSFFAVLAGTFNVHQELFECSLGPQGGVVTIWMSFSPSDSKDHEPTGSSLWEIEPDRANEQERRACWTESINTHETLSKPLPAFSGQAARTMPVAARARRPVPVLAVWTMEKIGAQCQCTTGSKLPEHPQLVGAQLEQM